MIRHKTNKFESYDVHADVYNWFNKYCMDLLDRTDYRWVESTLNNLDYTELANEAIIDLSLSNDEDTHLLVEDELEKLTSEFIDYMKFGKDNSFSRSNSDWLDKYNNKADYSASLESYKKENKMIRRKLTLEQRINRLEKLLSSNRRSRKFESNANFENFTVEEAREFARILKNRSDIAVEQCSVTPNTDTWFVVITDEDGDYVTNFGIYKINGHIEAWKDDRSRYAQVFNSVAECASSIDYDYDDGEYFW